MAEDLKIKYVPTKHLEPYSGNSRVHSTDQIDQISSIDVTIRSKKKKNKKRSDEKNKNDQSPKFYQKAVDNGKSQLESSSSYNSSKQTTVT